jgi:hypothetical protein
MFFDSLAMHRASPKPLRVVWFVFGTLTDRPVFYGELCASELTCPQSDRNIDICLPHRIDGQGLDF